jgi:hypothetical protein
VTALSIKLTDHSPAPPTVTDQIRQQAHAVFASFNTWAFKREQPSDPDRIVATIAGAIASERPVRFVLYWGKGPRPVVGTPERSCIAYLGRLLGRVATAHPPGGHLELVFTDTHALLNGHSVASTESYLQSVRQACDALPVTCTRLSSICSALPDPSGVEEPADEALLTLLEPSAARWYRGSGGPRAGAERYLAMNLAEKRAVEATFPDAIFLTFNGSALRGLFPDRLGIFYMYSIKKGVADKPWFMPDEG